MTRLSGEFQTDLALPSALSLCADAVHSLGWQIQSLSGNRIVCTAVSDQTDSEARVEIEVRESPHGTDLRVVGEDSGTATLQEPELVDLLDQLGDAIEARVEEADSEVEPPDDQEPEPAATEVQQAATAATVIQPQEQAKGDWTRVEDQAPPGWYPDPIEGEGERYWDGGEWTHRVRAGGPEPTPQQQKSEQQTGWWRQNRRAVIAGAFVFILGAAIGAAANDGGGTKTVAHTATKTAQAKARTTTQTTTVTKIQTPQTATATTNPTSTTPTSTNGAIVGPTTTPDASTGCDQSYANVCLDPNASDYDCKGGGGDGPKFVTGPVVIVGPDHFGLDGSDHDGVGCE